MRRFAGETWVSKDVDGDAGHSGDRETGLSAALFRSIEPGVFVVDTQRRIIAATEPAQRLIGSGASNQATTLPADLNAVIAETFTAGAPLARVIKSPSGLDLEVRTQPFHDAHGAIVSVMAEVEQRGEVESIGAKLEHLDRLAAIGVIAAGAAHEIKNALVAVRTYFELLASGDNDEELRLVAAREIQRIERTVRQLLRGARREEFRFVPVKIHTLLEDSLNLVRHQMQTRTITLLATLDAPRDRVLADDRQLRHTFVNLLINAAEALQSGGRVTLTTDVVEAWEREHLRVTVADDGPGIAPENLGALFTPFFTTKAEGTGLGLAITRQILEAHNGTITVESQPGKGTVFRVFLPLHDD